MKLLKRLRDPASYEAVTTPAILARMDGLTQEAEDFDDTISLEIFDDEQLGIGAAMAQDVAGLEFLDSCRHRIPDIHEEFPPHGLAFDDFAIELDS